MVSSSNDWTVSSDVRVSGCVLAVRVENWPYDDGSSSPYGLIGSSSTGLRTDNTWKCNTGIESGWTLCEFDDSHWTSAAVVGTNGDTPWTSISGVSASAKWIWSDPYADVTYCRKTLCD